MRHIKPMWGNNASVGFASDCTAGEVKVLAAAVCQLKRAPRQPIAALYVEAGGGYYNQEMVDPWDELRDARNYRGPFPVVAHPPCQRWGKYWHGAPNKPHQYRMGEDGGCFAAALTAQPATTAGSSSILLTPALGVTSDWPHPQEMEGGYRPMSSAAGLAMSSRAIMDI